VSMKPLAPTVSSPPQGGNTCGPAKPVPRFSPGNTSSLTHVGALTRGCVMALGLALGACSSTPPQPDWQMNAKGSADRATEAWLRGDSPIGAVEFSRARAAVASTGRLDLVARLELLRCATRVAALDFAPCTGYDAIAQDAAPAEQAYARYLMGASQATDAALLPEAHRGLAGGSSAPETAFAGIQDPLSSLVAAGVLLRRGQATPGVMGQAVDVASAQGWRRPLLAWLKVQQQRAQAGGATNEAASLQRRIDLIAPTQSR
jgi:hypothetical protein